MRILVTGSSGHLGSTIARLLKGSHTVIGVDIVPGEQTSHVGSITDRAFVYERVQGVDAVIHTASLHAPHVPVMTGEQFIDVNVKGTLNLLEASVEHKIRRFVYSSTTSLYGYSLVPKNKAVWVTETLPPLPRDIYDITKISAEQLCENFSRTHNFPVLCLRVSRFWDEGRELQTIHLLYRGVDVRDAAQAHVLAVRSGTAGFNILNISAQSPFCENDAATLLTDAQSVILRYYPTAKDFFLKNGWGLPNRIDRVYVINKAVKLLKYKPRYNFGEMIQ